MKYIDYLHVDAEPTTYYIIKSVGGDCGVINGSYDVTELEFGRSGKFILYYNKDVFADIEFEWSDDDINIDEDENCGYAGEESIANSLCGDILDNINMDLTSIEQSGVPAANGYINKVYDGSVKDWDELFERYIDDCICRDTHYDISSSYYLLPDFESYVKDHKIVFPS